MARTVSQAAFDVSRGALPMMMRCLRARVIATFRRFGLSENPRRAVREVDRMMTSRSAPWKASTVDICTEYEPSRHADIFTTCALSNRKKERENNKKINH